MKKLFLIPLLACFSCVMAWGATHEVSTYDELKALVPGAFSTNPLAAGDVVKLTSTIESSNSITWYVRGAFTLDLNGNDLKVNGFDLYAWEGSGEVTITNGRILPYNASTEYALKFSSSTIYDYVIDNVEIGAGSKAAIKVSAKSLTIQGTCSIPSIELAGDFPLTNKNTLTTSIIAASYNLNLTNNGSFTFGANTKYVRPAMTISGTGSVAIEAGAAFSDGAWGSVSSYKDDAHVAEKWALSYSVLGKKVYASTPTHVAKIGSEEYASFDAAFLDARLSGESKHIQLLSDANLLNGFTFGDYNVDITVDLNNHTLAMGNNYIYQSPTSGTPSQKLAFENGTITSNASKIFNLSPRNACIPELSLNNVTLTNTYNQSNALISKRGIGIETAGKAKIALLGTTTATVKLTSLFNLSSFDLNNEAQCHVYVCGVTTTTSNHLAYIGDNSLLEKFGAENSWWEIQTGLILPAVKEAYTSHIKGNCASGETYTSAGPTGDKKNYYKITESGATVIATVNGVNYYNFFDALDASSETYPAILQTNVYVSGLSALTGQNRYVNLNGHTIEQAGLMLEMNRIENGKLHFLGNGTVTTTAPFYIFGSSDASAVDYSVLEIAAGVTVTYDASFENYAIWVAQNASNKAYGVRVDLAGTVNSNVGGAYINGNIKTASEHAPIFNITGTLNAAHSGIYAAGYGIWNISGTVNGNDAFGIGIKAGKLNVTNNAVVYGGATSEFERVDAFGNGMNISGATLQIESNGSYGGNMEIVIADNATLSSANNTYAIYEYVDKYDAPTKVNSIDISGGKFQGGILISQDLAAKGGFVSGGKWSKDIAANVVVGKAANPITSGADYEAGYRFEVGDPTEATAEVIPAAPALLVSDQATEAEKAAAEQASDKDDVKTSGAGNQAVISQNTDVVKAGDNARVDAKKVTVEKNKELTVKDGAILMVGTGAVHLDNEATTGLKIEAGATMVVDGLVYGSTAQNFVIESSEAKAGIVLFSPETEFIREDHPTATYRFISKSYMTAATDKWLYQRLGIPTFDGNVHIKSVNHSEGDSWLQHWNYDDDEWSDWERFSNEGVLDVTDAVPFQGFVLASSNDTKGEMVYEFTGKLMGNMDANLHFRNGWNFYANSYTAPLNILEFIKTVENTVGSSDILATIYLYNDLGDDTYSWQPINKATAGSQTVIGFQPGVGPIYEEFPSVVEPMQAFLMKLNAGDNVNQAIDYEDNVYKPAVIPSNNAPARRGAANLNRMQVSVYNAEGFDKVFLLEDNNFSDALDNGYDAYKYEGNKGVQLYAMDNDNRMEILATDNVDGTFLGIDAPKAGTYTLYLSGINGNDYAIVDMLNNTVTNISEGAEYSFYAPKGNNDYRFQIVSVRQAPTGIEEAAVAKKAGIYTVTGQFVGRDFQALPAGVYVVNGKKVVK